MQLFLASPEATQVDHRFDTGDEIVAMHGYKVGNRIALVKRFCERAEPTPFSRRSEIRHHERMSTDQLNPEPYFRLEAGQFVATPQSRGPWSPTMLHGRVIAGLLAFGIERDHGDAEMVPVRFTVDMYRAPDFSPITIKTQVARAGHRIKVIDAEFVSNGVSMARASCMFLRRTANPPGNVWQPPTWSAPLPDAVPAQEKFQDGTGPTWNIRNISGGWGQCAQRRVWMSEQRELVGGVALTPFTRIGLISDFASPCANIGDAPLGFINTDVTVYLHRLPRGEWIGMETVNHGATEGIAIGECFIYDTEGPIGSASVGALAQIMRR